MATSTEKAQLTDGEIAQLTDAKKRLAAKALRLQAMRARAKAAGNSKLVAEIDADLKEANGFKAQVASIEATMKPFMDAYSTARLWVSDWFTSSLGNLGVIWIPYAVAAGITAVVYGINTWDRKTETSLHRYEAELKAHDEWVKRGKTDAEATALVKASAQQFSAEKQAEAKTPGLLSELSGVMKLGAAGLVALGVWKIWQSSQDKSNRRTA